MNINEIRELYFKEEMSCREISELYGVSSVTIGNWLKRSGAILRTNSEAKKINYKKGCIISCTFCGQLRGQNHVCPEENWAKGNTKQSDVRLKNRSNAMLTYYKSTKVPSCGFKPREFTIPAESQEFAWWLGATCSDGCVSNNVIMFANTDLQLANKWKIISERLFGVKINMTHRDYNKLEWNTLYTPTFSRKELALFLGDLSELNWPKTIQSNFSWLFSKEEYLKSFLSAYIDCEGHIPTAKYITHSISIAAKSENVKTMLACMLLLLNINCSNNTRGIGISGSSKDLAANFVYESQHSKKKQALLEVIRNYGRK